MHRTFTNLPAGLAIPAVQNPEQRLIQNIISQIKMHFKDEELNKRVEDWVEVYKINQQQGYNEFCKGLYPILGQTRWQQLQLMTESERQVGGLHPLQPRYPVTHSHIEDDLADFHVAGYEGFNPTFVKLRAYLDRPRESPQDNR